jgi:ribosomal protein L13E
MKAEDSNPNRLPLVRPKLTTPERDTFRQGRGFSRGEIEKAGASVDDLKTAHLRMDRLRRSVHEVNIKSLKELLGTPAGGKSAQRGKPKEKAKTASKKEAAKKKKQPKTSPGKK